MENQSIKQVGRAHLSSGCQRLATAQREVLSILIIKGILTIIAIISRRCTGHA